MTRPWHPREGEWVTHRISKKRLLIIKEQHKGYYPGTFIPGHDGWLAKDEDMKEYHVYLAELAPDASLRE